MSIQESLIKLFEENRIVVWYDAKQEFTEECSSLCLPGVEKIEVNNNEFYVKYKILHEQPQDKFLLYIPSAQPDNEQNWLLDVVLANATYATDAVSQILLELGKGPEYRQLVEQHLNFFNVKTKTQNNLEKIRSVFDAEPTEDQVRDAMLYIACQSDSNLPSALEKLFVEYVKENKTLYNRIDAYALSKHFWKRLENTYGYVSDNPNLQEFFHRMFLYSYYITLAPEKKPDGCTPDADSFVKSLKNSRQSQLVDSFRQYTEKIYNDAIQADIASRSIDEFGEQDIFRAIDERILAELTKGVCNRTMNPNDCLRIIQARKQTFWYESDFKAHYQSLECAAKFFQLVSEFNSSFASAENAFALYTSTYYKIDQLYRQFNYYFNQTETSSQQWKEVQETVERYYVNGFVEKLNNAWSNHVSRMTQWRLTGILNQSSFYGHCVKPKLSISNGTPKNRVFVIISDALRYEIGAQLCDKLRTENRLTAEIEPILGSLPSITRLGMAAMLPHKTPLQFYRNSTDNSLQVRCDNLPTISTPQRQEALRADSEQIKACAVDSKEIFDMTRDEGRERFKSVNVIYIYENIIDSRSHSEASVGDVFKAAQETIDDLIKLVKKLVTFNGNKIMITADHGFLYQKSDVQPLSTQPQGDIFEQKSRYVIGNPLEASSSFKSFTAQELGLQGDLQFQFPNSYFRLPLSGSSGQFVHGGYSLEEVAIPVITVSPQREGKPKQVDIEIWSTTDTIVGGVFPFALSQNEPVRNQVGSRKIKVGLYSSLDSDRVALSDVQTHLFDVDYDNNKEPGTKRFQLRLNSQANEFNGRTIYLIVSDFDDDNDIVKSKEIQLRMFMEHDF